MTNILLINKDHKKINQKHMLKILVMQDLTNKTPISQIDLEKMVFKSVVIKTIKTS